MRRVFTKNQKAVSAFLSTKHQQYHTQSSILSVATNAKTRVTPTSLNSQVYENPNAKRVAVEKKYLRKAQAACDKRNPETVETTVQNIIEDLRINNVPVPSIEVYTQCINALVKSQKSDKAHKYYDMMMQHYSLTQIPISLLVYMINACKYKKEEVRAVDYFNQFKEKLKIHEEAGDSIPHRDEIITRAYTNLINSMSNVLDKEKCDLYFEEFKSTYGEDKVDYSLYGCMMKVNSFLQNYDDCAKIMDTIKERVYTIIPTGTDMAENNPSKVLTLFYNMMITSCQTLEQTEIVKKQMEDEQITYDHQTYVNLMKKYLQFDEYSKMYDLYENHLKSTTIRAKEPVFFLLLEACYREAFQRANEVKSTTGNDISKTAIFDMTRIKRYWSEMRNKYGNKEPSDVMIESLRKIVQENKQFKKEYRSELNNLFKKQKLEKIEQLKNIQNEEKKQK
ncbi:predicted protein [Naegleria gruberi]|uniref:Predicted protein n=1 Tax=Naegleria gruberi TaxID=5762 RepID=D2V0Y0_NAEGR|nr:uncharacterized protein NAEGRDRAFT_45807 [Naegleria gruberi]EFC49806.1 predicted protein [Naegleria gruberi]|eukprot:XP_002682550.1 predicted protein [Naegleria gruberi strain NEG-M]